MSRLRVSLVLAVCIFGVLGFSADRGLLFGVPHGNAEAGRLLEVASVARDRAVTAPRRSTLAPAKGALLGALIEQREGIFWSKNLQLQFERTIGRKLAINHVFYWTASEPRFQCSGEWPTAKREVWNYKRGTISMISWVPEIEGDDSWLDNFASGQDDQCFRRMAKALKGLKIPVLLRFMHEMNGNWYPWSGPANGGGKIGERRYREAWIHVWKIFQQEGAANVRWVWCPDSGDTPGDGSQHWTGYYPGDKYVDWVCTDVYNFNVPQWGPWVEFSQILGERWMGSTVYADYARRKPFMIGEAGSQEDWGVPGRKGKWFVNARNALKSKYPLVRALVYFSTIWDDKDWRIQTSASSLAGFRTLARDPYFRKVARKP